MLRIAVTGAGGRLGGQVMRILATESEHHVVGLFRREVQLEPSLDHVDTAYADYTDPPALRTALRDVDTLVFISSDGDAAKVLLHHDNVIRAAVDAGVGHVVALSGVDADLESPFCYAVTNGYTERLLHNTGCPFSIARASLYTEFFMRWLTPARADGEIRLPAADGRISLVSQADVARCLAALAVAPPTGSHHDITGPESLDLFAIAALTGQEWQTPIRYTEVTPTQYALEMARAGEDPWWMYAFSTMFDSIRGQRWDAVSNEATRLTGQPPTSLRDHLARHEDMR